MTVKSAGGTKIRERTCAACRETGAPDTMVRWVRADEGAVVPDLRGRSFGRGAWVHPRPECLKRLQPALQKSFKAQVTTSTPEALQLLRCAAICETQKLLGQARRQGLMIFGMDRTGQAWQSGEVHLVMVAQDARASSSVDFVGQAVTAGKAVVWSTKAELGGLFGRAEIGVLGVTDRGLAQRLFGAIAMALLVQPAPCGDKSSGPDFTFVARLNEQ